MIEKSDTPIAPVLARLAGYGMSVSALVPTRTGLDKAILDAVGPLRSYLKRCAFHDYDLQPKGQKRVVDAFFVWEDRLEATHASLYRPETKDGDPRVWFYGLPRYAKPYNLLCILALDNVLYIINASNQAILESLDEATSPLHALAERFRALDASAAELLELLREICRKGFVRSLRAGDTGIGFTLESMLGIRANTARTPDFKGIELKASRRLSGARRENRVTLFSQVPNWKASPLGSGGEILRKYGYQRGGRRQLYCTVAAEPNPQGLFFRVHEEDEALWNCAKKDGSFDLVACWESSMLGNRLLEKHPATMWVKAQCRKDRDCETFHYTEAIYTQNPIVDNLLPLIAAGTVTMDYTLSELPNGRTRDHGYLFKIRPAELSALFPPPRKFELAD